MTQVVANSNLFFKPHFKNCCCMNKKNALSKSVCLLTFLLVFSLLSFSQNNFKVTGKVTDESGKPLQGATVTVKGTAIATATGEDGSFTINAPSGRETLVITSVGFAVDKYGYESCSTLNISH